MKVIRLHAAGDLRLHEEPLPKAGRGQCLIRVKVVGVCGSDLHWLSSAGIGDASLKHPLVLGHEFAGETEDGRRVAVDPAIPCGECEYCLRGDPNLCPQVIFAGHAEQDGALREWLAWEEKCLFPLPEELSYAEGAMLEPLGIAMHALNLGKVQAGMTVGVFGCGPIGILIIRLARLAGAVSVIATDLLPQRVEAAMAYGASQAFCVSQEAGIEELKEAIEAGGAHVTFEAAGDAGAVEHAFAAVLPGGRVVLVGIPEDDRTWFNASLARRKGLTIKLVRRSKHTYPRAIELVSSGLVDVASLVTQRFPLERAAEAFRAAERREGLKVMIEG